MKKIIGATIAILIVGSIVYFQRNRNNGYTSTNIFFEQRLQRYIENQFSKWYYCDEVKWSKYFFDFVYFPYKRDGEYLVSFGLWWYNKTELGNITSCGWGWELLIVKDDGEKIYLVHKFDEFKERNLPKEVVKLLKNKQRENTAYEQAKKYFKIEENKNISQKCPKYLCNKTWYQLLEDGDNNKTNDIIFVYSTTPPKEMENEWRRWTLNFVDNHDMTEIDRSCSNNENDGRCRNITTWKIINKNTISYPLTGDPKRQNRIELMEISKDTLKYIHLYD